MNDSNAPGADPNVELYQELVRILHDCLMRGVEGEDVKTLMYQCGVDRRDIERYVPTIQRSKA